MALHIGRVRTSISKQTKNKAATKRRNRKITRHWFIERKNRRIWVLDFLDFMTTI